jgi:hypothetical protein
MPFHTGGVCVELIYVWWRLLRCRTYSRSLVPLRLHPEHGPCCAFCTAMTKGLRCRSSRH